MEVILVHVNVRKVVKANEAHWIHIILDKGIENGLILGVTPIVGILWHLVYWINGITVETFNKKAMRNVIVKVQSIVWRGNVIWRSNNNGIIRNSM